jgi:hypothetical protein
MVRRGFDLFGDIKVAEYSINLIQGYNQLIINNLTFTPMQFFIIGYAQINRLESSYKYDSWGDIIVYDGILKKAGDMVQLTACYSGAPARISTLVISLSLQSFSYNNNTLTVNYNYSWSITSDDDNYTNSQSFKILVLGK